jgi:hypothetical protein
MNLSILGEEIGQPDRFISFAAPRDFYSPITLI